MTQISPSPDEVSEQLPLVSWINEAGERFEAPVPRLLIRYVRAVGLNLTLDVLLHFGGGPLYFADQPTEGSRLARLIGLEPATALWKALGPGHVTVPLALVFSARLMKAQGEPVVEIARILHVYASTVRRYLQRPTAGACKQ